MSRDSGGLTREYVEGAYKNGRKIRALLRGHNTRTYDQEESIEPTFDWEKFEYRLEYGDLVTRANSFVQMLLYGGNVDGYSIHENFHNRQKDCRIDIEVVLTGGVGKDYRMKFVVEEIEDAE